MFPSCSSERTSFIRDHVLCPITWVIPHVIKPSSNRRHVIYSCVRGFPANFKCINWWVSTCHCCTHPGSLHLCNLSFYLFPPLLSHHHSLLLPSDTLLSSLLSYLLSSSLPYTTLWLPLIITTTLPSPPLLLILSLPSPFVSPSISFLVLPPSPSPLHRQSLYDNEQNVQDAFLQFWQTVAAKFRNNSNVLGYELINEPWAGDVYRHPDQLSPRELCMLLVWIGRPSPIHHMSCKSFTFRVCVKSVCSTSELSSQIRVISLSAEWSVAWETEPISTKCGFQNCYLCTMYKQSVVGVLLRSGCVFLRCCCVTKRWAYLSKNVCHALWSGMSHCTDVSGVVLEGWASGCLAMPW